MPDLGQLSVDVLRRLGMAGNLPKTDYYTHVSARVDKNAPYPRNLPSLIHGGKPASVGNTSGLAKYPNVAREWNSLTQQYPALAASDVNPMGMLEQARNFVGSIITGRGQEMMWNRPAIQGRASGNEIRFHPSVESESPENIRRLLLHEGTHTQQTRQFPTQEWSDTRYYRPKTAYWTSMGENQAFEAEDQDANGGRSYVDRLYSPFDGLKKRSR